MAFKQITFGRGVEAFKQNYGLSGGLAGGSRRLNI